MVLRPSSTTWRSAPAVQHPPIHHKLKCPPWPILTGRRRSGSQERCMHSRPQRSPLRRFPFRSTLPFKYASRTRSQLKPRKLMISSTVPLPQPSTQMVWSRFRPGPLFWAVLSLRSPQAILSLELNSSWSLQPSDYPNRMVKVRMSASSPSTFPATAKAAARILRLRPAAVLQPARLSVRWQEEEAARQSEPPAEVRSVSAQMQLPLEGRLN